MSSKGRTSRLSGWPWHPALAMDSRVGGPQCLAAGRTSHAGGSQVMGKAPPL